MLKEIFSAVQQKLTDNITSLKICDRYKGEFEPEADWNPDFPCVLIRYEGLKPVLTDRLGKVVRKQATFLLYIADKDIESSVVFDTVEDVADLFDGTSLLIETGLTMKCKIGETGWYGYNKGVEVYTLKIVVQ